MQSGLAGRVAIITGGSEGIGRATALALAREGARVAICARRPDVLEAAAAAIREAADATVIAVPADVRQPAAIEAAVARVVAELGPPTILVNNAGTSAAAPFDQVGDDAWADDMDLKLMAAVRLSRLVVPHMRAAGGGAIVNVTAVAGKAPGPGSLPTSVSRAAGIALTKAMSKDLAKDNIRVNTVCIGLVKSAQIERNALRRFPGSTLEEAFARLAAPVPLGRVGEAAEAANVIAFLVSDLASYVTGAAINVDGGMAATV
jgi:NAD(P)-dependent dehydrogenase (short-subunit alcohol dehydrogenase family)